MNKFEPVLLDQISLKRALKFKTKLEEGYVYVTTRNTYWVWLPFYKVWVKKSGGRASIATFYYKKSTVSKQNPDGLSLKADPKSVDKEQWAAIMDNHERIVRKYGLDEHPRLKVDEEPEVPEPSANSITGEGDAPPKEELLLPRVTPKDVFELTREEFLGLPVPGVEITETSTPDDFDAALWAIVQGMADSSTNPDARRWGEEQLLSLGVKPPTREVLIRAIAPTKVTPPQIIEALSALGINVIEID